MNRVNFPFNYKAIGLSVVFLVASFISYSPQILARQAKPIRNNARKSVTTVQIKLPPAPKTGTLSGTVKGGKRKGGNCPDVTTPLTALIATYRLANGEDYLWGQTIDERPTFWVYVPYSLSASRPGELRLQETQANGDKVLTTVVTVNGTSPGVVGVRLPVGKTLKPNQAYLWQFVVRCDPDNASANQFVSTAVTRVQPSPVLANQLRNATPSQKAAIYAREGFWYDAVTAFASLRKANPRDAQTNTNWQTLLRTVHLDNLAGEQIAN